MLWIKSTLSDSSVKNKKLVALAIGCVLAYASTRSILSGQDSTSIVFSPFVLVVMAAIYVVFAIWDGRRSALVVELSGLTIFASIAAIGMFWFPYAIGIGLILHGVWDIAHHPNAINTNVPAWYPPLCAIYDFLLAGVFFAYASTIVAA